MERMKFLRVKVNINFIPRLIKIWKEHLLTRSSKTMTDRNVEVFLEE